MELLDFSAYGELYLDPNESTQPAPVAADPDRQNYQSFTDISPRRGDKGTDISEMQQALVDAGVTSISKVDGAFGINTEKGVQEFQKMKGLPETGIFDEETRATLFGGAEEEETTAPAAPEVTTETQETTTTTTTTVTDLIYSDFVDSKQEGDEAHVGQDSKNITLAGGVVPDGLVYDGKAHTQDKTEITNFDKSKLDTSGAYKKVGNKTIRRSDYDSDKAFAKGVIGEFTDKAKSAAGTSWDSMSDGSKKAVVKIGWNKGTGWYTGSSAKAIYAELAKDNPSPTNLYSKVLAGSTVKDGGASIGIAKARANAWNETISATGGSEITKIVANNSGTNTHFEYYDKGGKLLYTEKTTRATSIYENGTNLSVEKNAKGEW